MLQTIIDMPSIGQIRVMNDLQRTSLSYGGGEGGGWEEPNHTTTRKHGSLSFDSLSGRYFPVLGIAPSQQCLPQSRDFVPLPRYRVSPGSNPDTPTPGLQATNPWSFVVETPVSCRALRSQLQVIIAPSFLLKNLFLSLNYQYQNLRIAIFLSTCKF